ncbi:hypothetical protein LTR17_004212 [Elasticomyces elasticus]|nr:hypothetical protein LTR17_004212 [Elasticomyces elasticus]
MATTSKNFFPHHRVSIRYPFAPQDHPRRDQFTMLPVHNAANRYEPICSIADTQVAENQVHTSQKASIFSYSEVRRVSPEDLQTTVKKLRAPFDESESDVECLVREMALWTAYHGFSYLDMMTYNHVGPGKKTEIYVHIQRHSLLKLGGPYGQSIREDSSYEIPLSTFEAIPTTAVWHTNALDVLHRSSDRAVHHANLYLKNQDLPDVDVHCQLGNHRFNDFETFVRQTSDLDVEAGEQASGELKVHSELLMEIWKHLAAGALLETATSTPLHLQAVRSPEFQLISSLTQDLFEDYHGQTWTAVDLYQALAKDIRTALKEDFRHSHAFGALLQSDQLPVVNDGAIESYLRPGVLTFILRTLSRTIQFDLLRECHDTNPGCAAVWHTHGVKAYYNANLLP